MNSLKTGFVVVALCCLSACGRVIQSAKDGGANGGTSGANAGTSGANAGTSGGNVGTGGGHAGTGGTNAGTGGTNAGTGGGHAGAGGTNAGTGGANDAGVDGGKDAGTDVAACSQAPVNLRSADGFAVLAGATVTSTGPTSVTGDLGVSPGTAITGFPPGSMVGMQHAGDPTSAQAIADLTTAYNDAKGRTLCPVSVAGDLSGQTLTPGLYKSTSSLEVSTGNLVLDAMGDGEAVFIFQMASTLTTTDGRQVMLSNGAKATNVYWQVGTSATIGTTSVFAGTIMADQAITLKTGATLNGRALARIAAITLDSNVIVKPAP